MLQRVIEFFSKPTPKQPVSVFPAQAAELAPVAGAARSDVAASSRSDAGIPVRNVAEIVAGQRELIGRIYRSAGLSREEFASRIEPVIENLARYVHWLPATRASHHRAQGDLFRLSLEVGLHAMQAASASVFPTTGGVERRFFMQPKWSLATLLAGLCSQLYRPVNHMSVLDRDNNEWPALLTPLHDWALSRSLDIYFVRWLKEPDTAVAQATAAYLVNMIVPASTLQYLAADNNQVLPAMTAALIGAPIGGPGNAIARIIAPTITRIVGAELNEVPINDEHMSAGIHLEPYLVDAMRRLVKAGTWACNSRTGVLWVGCDGVFINWTLAANDLVNLLTRDGFAGVPRDPDELAEMLCKAEVFERAPDLTKYWTITLPGTGEFRAGTVKLREREIIFPAGHDLSPYAGISLSLNPAEDSAQVDPAPQTGSTGEGRNATELLFEEAKVTDPHPGAPSSADQCEPRAAQPMQGQKPPLEDRSPQKAPRDDKSRRAPGNAATVAGAGDARAAQPRGGSPATAERLLGALTKDNAALLREIQRRYRTQRLAGTIAWVPQGVGISDKELMAHGKPLMDLLDELALKQWLWVDKTKPTRKIHAIDIAGRPHQMIVLKPDIARGLGFVRKAQ